MFSSPRLEQLPGFPRPVEMERAASCLLCGASQFTTVLRAGRNHPTRHTGPRFNVCRCEGCGLVFTNPRPSRNSIGLFYEDYFDGYKETVSDVYARRAAEMLRIPGVPRTGRILDVGCGTGTFLVEMGKLGWTGMGIEPEPVACEFARTECGLDVRLGELSAAVGADPFDMITLWHTLEHVHDPLECLRLCHDLLKPGGVLVVEVPNFGSLQARVFGRSWFALMVPEHVWHFAPATLGRMLEQSRFAVLGVYPSFDRAGWGTSARMVLSDLKQSLRPSRPLPPPARGEDGVRNTAPGVAPPQGLIGRLQDLLNAVGHFAEGTLFGYRFGTLAMRAVARKAS